MHKGGKNSIINYNVRAFNCDGCSVAIIVAISILFTNGEQRAEANDCQLGCGLSFICNHAITISVRHLRASFEWIHSISLS